MGVWWVTNVNQWCLRLVVSRRVFFRPAGDDDQQSLENHLSFRLDPWILLKWWLHDCCSDLFSDSSYMGLSQSHNIYIVCIYIYTYIPYIITYRWLLMVEYSINTTNLVDPLVPYPSSLTCSPIAPDPEILLPSRKRGTRPRRVACQPRSAPGRLWQDVGNGETWWNMVKIIEHQVEVLKIWVSQV